MNAGNAASVVTIFRLISNRLHGATIDHGGTAEYEPASDLRGLRKQSHAGISANLCLAKSRHARKH
jgi:hypothetical protein